MNDSSITRTEFRGLITNGVECGATTYQFIYTDTPMPLPRFVVVEVDGVQIPIHYEISDVVENVVAYGLGIENGRLTGILVSIGTTVKRKDFMTKAYLIIKAINGAIDQAIEQNMFDHEWESSTEMEMTTTANMIASHFYNTVGGYRQNTPNLRGRVNNRRYPHTCIIRREILNDNPMEDGALSGQGDNDDPMFDDDPLLDDDPTGDDNGGDDGNQSQNNIVTIYDGICRSEAKLTTDGNGEVITSTRRLSIPLTNRDWKRLQYKPVAGDRIEVDKDGTGHEWGEIIDFLPNELGTTIIYDFNRN